MQASVLFHLTIAPLTIDNDMLHVLMPKANSPTFVIPTPRHLEIATQFGAAEMEVMMILTTTTIPRMITIHMEITKTAAITTTAAVVLETMTDILPPTMHLQLNRLPPLQACGTFRT